MDMFSPNQHSVFDRVSIVVTGYTHTHVPFPFLSALDLFVTKLHSADDLQISTVATDSIMTGRKTTGDGEGSLARRILSFILFALYRRGIACSNRCCYMYLPLQFWQVLSILLWVINTV